MFNNEITYNEKWKTEYNEIIHKKLTSEYLNDTRACSDCPFGWAPFVYDLLKQLDEKYGIKKNTDLVPGYNTKETILDYLLPKKAWRGCKQHFYDVTKVPRDQWKDKYTPERIETFNWKNSVKVFKSFFSIWGNGISRVSRTWYALAYNKIKKPGISFSQIKEKYGYLTIYYSVLTDKVTDEEIDRLIKDTEVRMALSGSYYPLHSLVSCTTTRYRGEEKIVSYPYREAAIRILGEETLERYLVSALVAEGKKEEKNPS